MTELTAAVTEAFAKDEIGVGHALLLAKLQPAEQEQALSACFREDWNDGQGKAKHILLPVRHLHQWIEQNILLIMKDAPFSKTDPNVNPAADGRIKAEQEMQRREEALANVVGLGVPSAIAAAVPVHLTKRDLIFIVEHLLPQLDERRVAVLARNRGIKKAQASTCPASISRVRPRWQSSARAFQMGQRDCTDCRSRISCRIICKKFVGHTRELRSIFKKVLGHSSLEMTRRYANLVTADLDNPSAYPIISHLHHL